MTGILNPRGRILKIETEPFLDDQEVHEDLTASIGLATTDQLLKFLNGGAGEDVDSSDSTYFQNPLLELWMSNQLVAVCSLNLSCGLTSDDEELETDEVDEPFYHVSFNRIFVDKELQRLGLGRHLAIAAGAYAATMVVEHLLKSTHNKASVLFYADFVSEGGARLYEYLVSEAESVMRSASVVAGLDFSVTCDAGF